MARALNIKLSDRAYAELQRQANAMGAAEEAIAALELERRFEPASPTDSDFSKSRDDFERHFGQIDLGYPTGADNERIDQDLAHQSIADDGAA